MSSASASPWKRPGKQNRPYFGLGTHKCGQSEPSLWRSASRIADRYAGDKGGLGELPMPKAAQSPLL
jgi:hypothetical protein